MTKNYKLHSTTKKLFQAMLDRIASAEESIDIQFMTFEGDSIGLKLSNALISAAKSGLKVRVTIDSYTDLILSDEQLFLPHWPTTWLKLYKEFKATRKMLRDMKKSGIEIKRTNQFSLLNPLKFIHHDHRKIVLIDKKIAFIGGFNVSEHNYKWNDTAVEIRNNQIVQKIAEIYETMLKDLPHQKLIIINQNAQIIQDNKLVMNELKTLILGATKNIYLESGYFRDFEIASLAYEKFQRGVNVKIIVPKNNNQTYVQLFQNNLKNKFPKIIFQRSKPDSMTHAKIALIDGTCVFGSSNFEYTDMKEIMLFIKDEDLARQFQAYFMRSE